MESDKIGKVCNKIDKQSNFPSSSSRNTILKGPKYTRWELDIPKSTDPYRIRLFEVPYKPPANELRHLGGLGVSRPRFRSKVHPLTKVQQLRRQTTGNRINFTLTEDPTAAKQSIPRRRNLVTQVKRYVDPVIFADNLESPKSPRSLSPTSTDASTTLQNCTTNVQINRHPSILKIPEDPLQNFLKNKRRASSQGLVQDQRQFVLEPHSPRENDILDFFGRIYQGKSASVPMVRNSKAGEERSDLSIKVHRNKKILKINPSKPIDGAFFGPIAAKRKQSVASKLSEKFQLPKAMVSRLAKKNSSKTAQEQSSRKSMRGHMLKPFPTSDSSGSDDCEDNLEKVKSLTLVRTGYCTIPTIRVSTRRRKDRLRTNRHLNKQQVNRIRYLFFGERQKWAQKDEIDLGKEPPPSLPNRTPREIISKPKDSLNKSSEVSFDQGHQKILFRLKRFLKQSQKEKDQAKNKVSSLNFEGYKSGGLVQLERAMGNEQEDGSANQNGTIKKISLYDHDQDELKSKGLLRKLKSIHPPALFKQTRTRQTFRGIDSRDGQYVDPNFMTKQRYPEENQIKGSRYVLQSTMRYHGTIRKRLQVDGVGYDEERFGFEDQQFLHCLATEWDENYVNELKAVKKFKKFQVKTDIIRMREVVRKNFNTYYILENLANLRHKQRHEESFIGSLNQFSGMCLDYLEATKVKAYDSLIQKTNHLSPLEIMTHDLELEEKCLKAKLEHVTESLLAIEQRWDTIMKLQNYYYALMDTHWRKQYDWIHRKASDGQLEVAIYSVDRCRSANIRDKNDPMSSGFAIIEYINGNIFPNMDRMRRVKPCLDLLKKGLHSMQSEVFTYLKQYNKTLTLYDNISYIFQEQSEGLKERREAKQKLIHFRQLRQEFIDERNHVLQYEANKITEKPLEQAINNLQIRRVAAICEEMYKSVMPMDTRPQIEQNFSTTTKFSRMHQYIMDVLHSLDLLPVAVLKFTETRVRKQRLKVLDEGRAAAVKQKRFELLQRQLRGFFGLLRPNTTKRSAPLQSTRLQSKNKNRD